MDPIHSDKNQSGNEEKPKKSALQSILATLARWGINFNDWAERYKPSIEVAAVIVALLALLFIYFQIDGINEQTKAIVAQNEVIRDQNEAIWFGFRPILGIKKITATSDILPYDSSLEIRKALKGVGLGEYVFYYTIENLGQSYAILDFFSARLITEEHDTQDSIETHQIISPQESIVESIILPLLKSGENVLKLNYKFKWERGKNEFERFEFEKFYLFAFEKESWRSRILSKVEFDSIAVSK